MAAPTDRIKGQHKGSRCDGCPYWHGIGCVFCYREQLKPKTGGKHEP